MLFQCVSQGFICLLDQRLLQIVCWKLIKDLCQKLLVFGLRLSKWLLLECGDWLAGQVLSNYFWGSCVRALLDTKVAFNLGVRDSCSVSFSVDV